jgi:predicted aldo/keto reductase-like oxidoreductase
VKYRKFGSIDWQASVLGFGIAGLTVRDEDPSDTGQAESVNMIRYAIDRGVNYLDLGYPYDVTRQELVTRVVERALRDGYREKVRISVTIPVSIADSTEDFDRYLNTQMGWLKSDRIDFCVLARLNRENWPRIRNLGFLAKAERAISDGRIGSMGFSFHDHLQILRKVLDEYDKWGFCQFQFSYMDVTHDPGAAGLSYAADRGMAVVVTEPLKGGRLTKEPPESVRRILANADGKRSLAGWGLRFVWNHPAVTIVVCDMSTMVQVIEDTALADDAEAEALTVQEELTINRVRDAYHSLRAINCASCRPCMPCPQGIDVPRIFEIYNDAIMYNDVETAATIYRDEGHHGDCCVECGACEKTCSRSIPLPIIAWLKTVHRLLACCETDAMGIKEEASR